MKKSVYKVPGGKLLKIVLEPQDNRIKSIRIMGDFFLHPEESIIELENGLRGAELSEDNLIELVENFLSKPDVILLGATSNDIVKAIFLAINDGS